MKNNEKIAIENQSEVKEEKNLNYRRFFAWGFGLLIGFMAVAYFAGFITFGSPEKPTVEEKKAYLEKDSIATASVAQMDSTNK